MRDHYKAYAIDPDRPEENSSSRGGLAFTRLNKAVQHAKRMAQDTGGSHAVDLVEVASNGKQRASRLFLARPDTAPLQHAAGNE